MVEILFSRSLVKVLFATETFAMGVNMPARAVVFNSIRKHDGINFRELEPGEYTQMAGRAGRRGLDNVGTVIMCCFGEVPPPQGILRTMLTGSSTRLQSQFRLRYNMILNLLRVEDLSVEGMIRRSFSEFTTQRGLAANEYPQLLARGEKTLLKLEDQFRETAESRIGAEDIRDYFITSSELLATNEKLLFFVLDSVGANGGEALIPGRILFVTAARRYGYVRTPAIVLRPPVHAASNLDNISSRSVVCFVLLPKSYVALQDASSDSSRKAGTVNYIGKANRRYYAIHEISLSEIVLVSAVKHKIDPNAALKDESAMKSALGASFVTHDTGMRNDLCNVFVGMKARVKKEEDDFFSRKSEKVAPNQGQMVEQQLMEFLLDAEKSESAWVPLDLRNCTMQGKDVLEFRWYCGHMEELLLKMRNYRSHQHPSIGVYYAALEREELLRSRVETLRHLLSNESLQLFPDFLQRKSVLRTLGYIDGNETVCVKGRVACEVNTCEEVIVTEMVFEGVLDDLEPAEIVAALSALVYEAKVDGELDAEMPGRLITCCHRMQTIATNIGQLQRDHGLDVDPGEYCDGALSFGLVHVVYEWALGVMFSDICELTNAQEGTIVRCITRLDELCRDVRNCARVVGNPTLYRKMEEASIAIKRDIVFASSLYVN
jgi:antiviral helicase SKI2